MNEDILRKKGFIEVTPGNWRKPARDDHRGLGDPERKQNEVAALESRPSRSPKGKSGMARRIEIVSFRQRQLDEDNLQGGAKPLRDAIARSLGLDDADPSIHWEYIQVITKAKRNTNVRITVTALSCLLLLTGATTKPLRSPKDAGLVAPMATATSLPPMPPSSPLVLPTPEPTASVVLAWDASPSPEVIGYKIYQGTNSGVYNVTTNVGNVLAARIYNLSYGKRYYWTATAYDLAGLESDYCNEVSYTPMVKTNHMVKIQPVSGPTLNGPWETLLVWPAIQLVNPTTNQFYKFAITNWWE